MADEQHPYRPKQLFPGQAEHEEILIFIRRHWMPFTVWLVLISVLLCIPVVGLAVAAFVLGLPTGLNLVYYALGVSSYLLLLNAIFFTAWIEQYLDVAIITTDRLVHIRQIGLFNRRVSELSLARVQDVSAQMHGYLQSIFQFGTVVVETAGGAPDFEIRNIAKPHVVANTILMCHDRLRAKEGLQQQQQQSGVSHVPVMELAEPSPSVIQAAIEQNMPSIAPPRGYRHQQLQSDLLSQAMEAKERVEEQVGLASPASAPQPPNRLPPRHGAERMQEGELVEGEHVSIDGLS